MSYYSFIYQFSSNTEIIEKINYEFSTNSNELNETYILDLLSNLKPWVFQKLFQKDYKSDFKDFIEKNLFSNEDFLKAAKKLINKSIEYNGELNASKILFNALRYSNKLSQSETDYFFNKYFESYGPNSSIDFIKSCDFVINNFMAEKILSEIKGYGSSATLIKFTDLLQDQSHKLAHDNDNFDYYNIPSYQKSYYIDQINGYQIKTSRIADKAYKDGYINKFYYKTIKNCEQEIADNIKYYYEEHDPSHYTIDIPELMRQKALAEQQEKLLELEQDWHNE